MNVESIKTLLTNDKNVFLTNIILCNIKNIVTTKVGKNTYKQKIVLSTKTLKKYKEYNKKIVLGFFSKNLKNNYEEKCYIINEEKFINFYDVLHGCINIINDTDFIFEFINNMKSVNIQTKKFYISFNFIEV